MKREIERILNARVTSMEPVGGGSISQAAVVRTAYGVYFAKWNDHPNDQFEREADGLEVLAKAKTSLRVPLPIAWKRGLLVMEYLEPAPERPDFDEAFGRGLAELHQNSARKYGFHVDNYCGATPQPNGWTRKWIDFYVDHRLRHVIARGGFGPDEHAVFEALFLALPQLLDTRHEPPALIHGDLWSGNRHNAGGDPAIIDPAPYYAHREAELGMMSLFGGFSQRVWDAYDEAYPLQPGWRDRLPLYELYHVLNHHALFGGGYAAQALAIAKRYG